MTEIIITRSIDEANQLVPHTKDLDFFGQPRHDYSKVFVWMFENGEYKLGMSGHDSLEHMIALYPGASVFNFSDYPAKTITP